MYFIDGDKTQIVPKQYENIIRGLWELAKAWPDETERREAAAVAAERQRVLAWVTEIMPGDPFDLSMLAIRRLRAAIESGETPEAK